MGKLAVIGSFHWFANEAIAVKFSFLSDFRIFAAARFKNCNSVTHVVVHKATMPKMSFCVSPHFSRYGKSARRSGAASRKTHPVVSKTFFRRLSADCISSA
jgi:hypothetical protein